MSRKTILGVIGIIGAVLTVFADQFGLTLDPTAMIAGLTALTIYILFEAKLDLKRIGEQTAKFKDPKFWMAFGSAVLVALNNAFGWNIPVETIVTVITMLMSLLFGKEYLAVK